MNGVKKLIANLIDEHKITGEEAIVLIEAVNHNRSLVDDLLKSPTKSNNLDNR